MIDGEIIEYYFDSISTWDTFVLSMEIGSCCSQQAFEALAILVALREWKRIWSNTPQFL